MSFNTAEYAWIDGTAVAGGRILNGITGVKYGVKQEKEYVYGKGGKPLSIAKKNKSYEGEIKVLQSELEAFIRVAPDGDITNLVLDNITFSYAPEDGIPTTDQMVGVEFTESMKELNQGDGFQEISLPVMFLDLKHNI